MVLKNRFFVEIFVELKSYLSCFTLFDNCLVESKIINCYHYTFFDLGFKYLVRIKKAYLFTTLSFIVLKMRLLESLFNETKIELLNFKNGLNNKRIWLILKKAFETRTFLQCHFLNSVKSGFAIGFCGIVGYMPKKYSLFSKKKVTSVFIIVSLDLFRKTFILSQKQVNKLASRSLYKLQSKLTFIGKKCLYFNG